MSILLTGADGELGRALCRQLLDRKIPVFALLHASDQAQFVQREEILRTRLGAHHQADLRCLPLDLDQKTAFAHIPHTLRDAVRGIIHCAGRTRFDISLDEAMRSNVHGSRQLWRWATECPGLERVTVLGSCYSSGLNQGTIEEAIAVEPPGWANAYERSKYLIEQDLAVSGLPWVLVRPATSISAGPDGRVERHGVVHQCLRLLHLGLLAVCPGHPAVTVPLTSSRFVADATLRAHDLAPLHSVMHACPSPEDCLQLGRILQTAHECFQQDSTYRRRRVNLPPVVALEYWQDLARARSAFGDGLLGASLQALEPFAPQLASNKKFTVDQARRYNAVETQPQDALLTAVCHQLLATQFGKKNTAAPTRHKEFHTCL